MLFLFKCGYNVPILNIHLGTFAEFSHGVGIILMTGLYYIIDVVYQLFMAIGSARLFKQETIAAFSQRIYIVLGIVMLFFVTFQLFKMLLEPDKLNGKGDDSGKALFTSIVTTIIMLALTTFVFKFAYEVQDNILAEDLIGKVLFGTSGRYAPDGIEVSNTDLYYNGGKSVATSIFSAFYYPKTIASNASAFSTKMYIIEAGEYPRPGTYSYNEIIDYVEVYGPWFLMNMDCDNMEKDIEFPWFLAVACAGYCAWVLLSFCLDLGVRVIKMAFYQIIAPIPISLRILPKQKKIFDKWLKDTLSCFADIFVRIFVMYFTIYVIKIVQSAFVDSVGALWAESPLEKPTIIIELLAKGLIIVGLFRFVQDAPKLFGDLFGIKMEGNAYSPGIARRFNENRALKAGVGFAGGAIGGFASNLKNAKTHNEMLGGQSNKFARGTRKLTSAMGGFASGAFNGAKAGYDPNSRMFQNIGSTRTLVANRRRDKEEARKKADNNSEGFRERTANKLNAIFGDGQELVNVTHRIEAGDKLKTATSELQALFNGDASYQDYARKASQALDHLNQFNQQKNIGDINARRANYDDVKNTQTAIHASEQKVTQSKNNIDRYTSEKTTKMAELNSLETQKQQLITDQRTTGIDRSTEIRAIETKQSTINSETQELTNKITNETTNVTKEVNIQSNLINAIKQKGYNDVTSAADVDQKVQAQHESDEFDVKSYEQKQKAVADYTAYRDNQKAKIINDNSIQIESLITKIKEQSSKLDNSSGDFAKEYTDLFHEDISKFDKQQLANTIEKFGQMNGLINKATKRATDDKENIERYTPKAPPDKKDGKK